MHIKDILAIVLAILAVPFMFIGLIDPLEGGIALILAVVLTVIAWALSQVRIPAIEWIPLVVAFVTGIIALALVIFAEPQVLPDGSVLSPVSLTVRVFLWIYRAATLVAVVGSVIYAVRIIHRIRHPETV